MSPHERGGEGGGAILEDDHHNIVSDMPLALQLEGGGEVERDPLLGEQEPNLLGIGGRKRKHCRHMEHYFVSQVLGVHRVCPRVSIWRAKKLMGGGYIKNFARELTGDIQTGAVSLPAFQLNFITENVKKLVKSWTSLLCDMSGEESQRCVCQGKKERKTANRFQRTHHQ